MIWAISQIALDQVRSLEERDQRADLRVKKDQVVQVADSGQESPSKESRSGQKK